MYGANSEESPVGFLGKLLKSPLKIAGALHKGTVGAAKLSVAPASKLTKKITGGRGLTGRR